MFGKRLSCSVSVRARSSEKAARFGGAPEMGKSKRVGIAGREISSGGAVDGEVGITGLGVVSEEESRADFSVFTGMTEGDLLSFFCSFLCSVVPRGEGGLARRESCWRAASRREGVPATTSSGESKEGLGICCAEG